jgi:hypothetical protein
MAKPFHVEITGKRRDTETVMRRLEGGDWKSASNGNSLVAYPTSSTVLKTSGTGDSLAEFNQTDFLHTVSPLTSLLSSPLNILL